MSEYVNELLRYINEAMAMRGTAIAIKIEKICGVNRRCSWYIYRYMSLLENKKLVYKWKKGTWIVERDKVPLLESFIIELVPRRNKKRKII